MIIRALLTEDKEPIRKLLWETNSFRSDEIEVALELVEENLSKQGKLTPEDYHIAVSFNDESKTVEGYVCFGKTPMTLHIKRSKPPNKHLKTLKQEGPILAYGQ
jgi:hypothetical protein